MIRSVYFAIVTAGAFAFVFSPPVCADPQTNVLPDYSIEKSCQVFAGHPRPLAVLSPRISFSRRGNGNVANERGKCAELAGQSERSKYQVLSRCLRAAISEAAWKDAVGTIK